MISSIHRGNPNKPSSQFIELFLSPSAPPTTKWIIFLTLYPKSNPCNAKISLHSYLKELFYFLFWGLVKDYISFLGVKYFHWIYNSPFLFKTFIDNSSRCRFCKSMAVLSRVIRFLCCLCSKIFDDWKWIKKWHVRLWWAFYSASDTHGYQRTHVKRRLDILN